MGRSISVINFYALCLTGCRKFENRSAIAKEIMKACLEVFMNVLEHCHFLQREKRWEKNDNSFMCADGNIHITFNWDKADGLKSDVSSEPPFMIDCRHELSCLAKNFDINTYHARVAHVVEGTIETKWSTREMALDNAFSGEISDSTIDAILSIRSKNKGIIVLLCTKDINYVNILEKIERAGIPCVDSEGGTHFLSEDKGDPVILWNIAAHPDACFEGGALTMACFENPKREKKINFVDRSDIFVLDGGSFFNKQWIELVMERLTSVIVANNAYPLRNFGLNFLSKNA